MAICLRLLGRLGAIGRILGGLWLFLGLCLGGWLRKISGPQLGFRVSSLDAQPGFSSQLSAPVLRLCKGNLLFLFFITAVFLVCGLGIGLLISTVTKSQQLAFMMSVIFTLLPSFLLSGFIFSISSMPKVIQIISCLVPAKYFLTVLRGIFLKGNGLAVLWPEVVPLILLASLVIMACVKRLKLTLE